MILKVKRVVRWKALIVIKAAIAHTVETLMSFIGKILVSVFGLASFFMITIVVFMMFSVIYGVIRDLILK